MIKLDYKLLKDSGLGDLPKGEQAALLDYIQNRLHIRITQRLVSHLDIKILKTFRQHIKSKQNDKALKWLQEHAPNYREVVKQELELMRKNLKDNAQQILKHAKKTPV